MLTSRGHLVLTSLDNMHVHLREPGYEYKETSQTGVAAALEGGFTSLACMANTEPVNDSAAVTQYILDRARIAQGARVYPIGALSQGLRGERLAEVGEMHRAGIVGISDDGRPVIDAALMRRALEYSSMFGLPVIAHEEEPHLAAGGAMNEGVTALRLGLRGIPAAAEEVMIARDLALARLTGGRLHVAHVSTKGAVALLREAKVQGLPAGTPAPGAAADLTLVDPERRWRVEARAFRSKGRNTPFEGWDMTGRAVAVLVGGRLVHDERPATAPALRSAS